MLKNTLNTKQRCYLRSLGMTEDPVINIGKEGITPSLVLGANDVITKRELVKVNVLQNCPLEVKEAITLLAERSDCDLVQIIGRKGLLFRRNFKKPKITFPNNKKRSHR